MSSMIIWVLVLAGSIASVCFAVALESISGHLIATALVTLGLVAAGVHDHRSSELAGANLFKLSATAARYMGLMWAWTTISAFVVYTFLLDIDQWMVGGISMFVVCGLCLFVALILDREAVATKPDAWASALVRWMVGSQFVLSALLIGCVIAFEFKPASNGAGVLSATYQWVAANLILCTATGLMTFTGYLIMHHRHELAISAQEATSPG
jgi:hypothetical protein